FFLPVWRDWLTIIRVKQHSTEFTKPVEDIMKIAGRFIPVATLVALFAVAASAQVTHGQKPNLPAPFATKSAGNGPERSEAPAEFLPKVPAGFHISVFAKNFKRPRLLTVAPNGDIFLAETGAKNIVILRDPKHTGGAERTVFASRLVRPFGIVFHDDYVY